MTRQTTDYDNLIAADFPIVTDRETLITGQNLVDGALLGKITASKKLTSCESSSTDGSQNPFAILVNDTDATSEDIVTDIYLSGAFFEDQIVLSETGDLIADFKDALRALGLYMKAGVSS